MRILKLEFENLNSLKGKWEIDFTSEDFKKNHDILFNVIYKSNYDALKWLAKCGFKVLDLNNKNYKLFYFTKGGINFDLRYIAR